MKFLKKLSASRRNPFKKRELSSTEACSSKDASQGASQSASNGVPRFLFPDDLPTEMAAIALASPASLGTGHFSSCGSVENFQKSPSCQQQRERQLAELDEFEQFEKFKQFEKPEIQESFTESTETESVFLRHTSSFLRVADLQMDDPRGEDPGGEDKLAQHTHRTLVGDLSSHGGSSIGGLPNYHYSSTDPPPGVSVDKCERWVALDDGKGQPAPIAPAAVMALAKFGLVTALNAAMWTPDSKTAKLLKCAADSDSWQTATFSTGVPCPNNQNVSDEILIWCGSFCHGLYGSDLPAVRAAAVIHTSPEQLLDLLVDSARVQEYNSMSLGRDDLLVLQDSMEDTDGPHQFHGITKVTCSESRPPMLRKTLQFTTLLHARCSTDGYELVSRAVNQPNSNPAASVLVSEIILGVNLIRRVEGEPNKCLFITVNHIRSPMVPVMIAKRLGLAAAANFISDLRRCF